MSLLFAWQTASAQLAPAGDFFDRGAQFYISNNIPDALQATEDGLKQYPDDVKLKKLYQLLKQQQSQSSQSQQNQNQKNQSQNKQQSQQQKNQQQQKQNEQNQSSQKKAEQQKQQQESAQKQNQEKQENQNKQNQAQAAGQMTPEEAKRLLDAEKGDEQVLQWKPPGKPENPNQPVKDW